MTTRISRRDAKPVPENLAGAVHPVLAVTGERSLEPDRVQARRTRRVATALPGGESGQR